MLKVENQNENSHPEAERPPPMVLPIREPNPFEGKTFVLSGVFHTRTSEVKKIIEAQGGFVRSHVSSVTSVLVCAKRYGRRVMETAASQPIPIAVWTEEKLLELLNSQNALPKEEATPVSQDPVDAALFNGKRVVIGGVLRRFSQHDLKQLLADLGARVTVNLSSLTKIVIEGQRAGKKMMNTARANGCKIISETALWSAFKNNELLPGQPMSIDSSSQDDEDSDLTETDDDLPDASMHRPRARNPVVYSLYSMDSPFPSWRPVEQ